MAGTDLLPCPFCGGEARICAKHFTNGIAYAWVECGRCHAKSRYSDSIEDLSLAWNARAERIEVYPDGESGISINGITYVPELTCHDRNASAREHGAYLFMWRCSNCGESYDTEMDKPNYCPNCGARVVSE